ncbi:ABC transporter [candidate division BRC1 bacterium HGW-BRC1-1]|jgi:ABC-2 type transport system ATP-binding protein|nr:MAG: ABC transporter [candidate division BRC1 bacterium HGW-BRC1-1]
MIEVDNITKSYGTTRALTGASFRISKGEIVGFLGPNGAGKSTTMKILTCYIPADSGRATVAGHDVFTDSLEVRRRIGYLPENTPLYMEMLVVDFLRFVGGMRGLKGARLKKRVGDVIGLTGLEGAVGKYIGELSKGYRQRVGLAQALIHEPDILVLDEPTSGLDPNQIKDIRDLIREIGREKTVILSTHILPEVTATCDRAIIISDGRVVASGTPQELTSRGRGEQHVTASVRGPRPDVEAKLRKLAGVQEVSVLDVQDGVVRLELRGAKGDGLSERVYEAVSSNQWGLVELRRERATLEQVFTDLTT